MVSGYLFYVAKTTNVKDFRMPSLASSSSLTKDGNEAGSYVWSEKKELTVELTEISQDHKNAVIATEDRTL